AATCSATTGTVGTAGVVIVTFVGTFIAALAIGTLWHRRHGSRSPRTTEIASQIDHLDEQIDDLRQSLHLDLVDLFNVTLGALKVPEQPKSDAFPRPRPPELDHHPNVAWIFKNSGKVIALVLALWWAKVKLGLVHAGLVPTVAPAASITAALAAFAVLTMLVARTDAPPPARPPVAESPSSHTAASPPTTTVTSAPATSSTKPVAPPVLDGPSVTPVAEIQPASLAQAPENQRPTTTEAPPAPVTTSAVPSSASVPSVQQLPVPPTATSGPPPGCRYLLDVPVDNMARIQLLCR
ncbi:MAG: hypothetical protein ACRDRL_06660, partial [Sciscionella sp.]